MDMSKLEGEALKAYECPTKFLYNFQHRWREETGSARNANVTTEKFFKIMAKNAMPQEVQKCLGDMEGLMKMPWELFEKHIVHHVDRYRKEQRQQQEQEKQVSIKGA